MKRSAYLAAALAMTLLLSACGGSAGIGSVDQTVRVLPAEGTPDRAETDSADTKDGAADSAVLPTDGSAGMPDGTAGTTGGAVGALNREELALYTAFLNQEDVYGFLLSDYDDVLDADYYEVFYNGAGVGEYPSPTVLAMFLDAWGFQQPETDVTCVSAENVNAVLERRTGHTLEELYEHGSSFPQSFLPDLHGWYAHMHGDTNRFQVQAVSGVRNPGGTVTIESRDAGWGRTDEETEDERAEDEQADFPEEEQTDLPQEEQTGLPEDSVSNEDSGAVDLVNTFSTTLREQTDGGPLVVSNHVTGGLLKWSLEHWDGPVEITMERPPFDGWYLCPLLDVQEPDTFPAALKLLREYDNGGAAARQWMEEHWEIWMEDPRFAAEQDPEFRQLADQDQWYSYIADNDIFRGQGVSVYENSTQDPVLFVDLFSYLFPDNAAAAGSDGTDAQSVRWARLLNGTLFFSNASELGAESTDGQNAYLTAIRPADGLLVWRTEPLVCGSMNFAVLGSVDERGMVSGGILLCGYGEKGGASFLYQIDMETGMVLDRTPIASPPDWLVYANGTAYVHCADRNYEFAVRYD